MDMKSNYVVEGVWLAKWLKEQAAKMEGTGRIRSGTAKLTPGQIGKLEALGIGRR